MNCLETSIGLSRSECDCYSDIPETLKKSDFNLFLDELEGIDISLINQTLGCGETLENEFSKIKQQAITFLDADFTTSLNENYTSKKEKYVGLIGEKTYLQPLNTVAEKKGIVIKPLIVGSSVLLINKVELYVSSFTSGVKNLKIIKNTNGIEDILKSIDFNPVVGHNLVLNEVVKINFENSQSKYYIIFDGSIVTYDNKISCGCGSENVKNKMLDIKAVSINAGSEVYNGNFSNGLSLAVSIGCDGSETLCYAFNSDNGFATKLSIALWYKMGEILLSKFFASRNINFESLANGEYLFTRKKKYQSVYKQTIDYLAANISMKDNGCFDCGDRMNYGKILM
jgi:hypothetical protein